MQVTNPFVSGVDVTLALYNAPSSDSYRPYTQLWDDGIQQTIANASAGNSYPLTFGSYAATFAVSSTGETSFTIDDEISFSSGLSVGWEIALPAAFTAYLNRVPYANGGLSHNRSAVYGANNAPVVPGDTAGAWAWTHNPAIGGTGGTYKGTLLTAAVGWITSALPTLDTQTLIVPGTFGRTFGRTGNGDGS